jgi:integrase/recombinase XerD
MVDLTRTSPGKEVTMISSSQVVFVGPLADHREALCHELRRRGYTALSATNVLRVAAHLSRWLQASDLSLSELTGERIEAFFKARRRCGYTQFLTPRALKSVLPYLESQAGKSLAAPSQARGALLEAYVRYLHGERSLTVSTVYAYAAIAQQFLDERFAEGRYAPAKLRAEDVTAFVLGGIRHYRTGTTNYRVTALRSFLRYLYLEGALASDLSGAVPRAASWRQVGVPKGWNDAELRQLLRSCDRRCRVGRRNYAVLLLLVRLGLRRGEVAALRLEDIDWSCAEVTVCGKGRREARLPLPADVGEALARYLRSARPASDARRIFLAVRAPHQPIDPGAVTAIVRQQCVRAGLPARGAHRLRHTAATAMLRAGSSLDEIAQVLRHRSLDTTAIYAKVDRAALRAVARPWPGGAA